MRTPTIDRQKGAGMQNRLRAATAFALAAAGPALAQEQTVAAADTQRVQVTGHCDNSLGSSDAASAGTITPRLIESRPLQRPGTLLELSPAWR
jgi:hypothetical protein